MYTYMYVYGKSGINRNNIERTVNNGTIVSASE